MTSALAAPFDFSQSSLQDYADCPRRFQLRYLQHMAWPAVEAEPATEQELRQREGLQFHRMVHQHMLGVPSEQLGASTGSPELRHWWENYLSTDLGLSDSVRRSELAMFCSAGAHRLVAKYDLIATKDGQATIYDWKTYMRRPRDEWLAARWQTRVYRALLVRAGAILNGGVPFRPNKIKMVYWFAEYPGEPAVIGYSAQQFATDWAAIESMISEISAEREFPLTVDRKMCRFCVYRSYCDRGERAGASSDADAESAAGEKFDIVFDEIGEIEF